LIQKAHVSVLYRTGSAGVWLPVGCMSKHMQCCLTPTFVAQLGIRRTHRDNARAQPTCCIPR